MNLPVTTEPINTTTTRKRKRDSFILIKSPNNYDPIDLIHQLSTELSTKDQHLKELRSRLSKMYKIFENLGVSSHEVDLRLLNLRDDDTAFNSQVELETLSRGKGIDVSKISKDIDKYGFVKEVKCTKPIPPQKTTILSGIFIHESKKCKEELIEQLKMISKNHDISNLYFEKEWDTLIKDINIHHNMLLQDDVVIGVKFGGVRGLGLQQFYFPLVNLITQYGIPDKYRFIWLDLSGANNIRINGEYNELLSTQVTPEIQKIFNEIDLDLHRTLPSNFFFNNMFELKPGVNFYKLQRILYAFVIKFPEIGYVQGMNKIIGTLLLTEHDEENVFCLFIALIQEILPWYSNKPFFNSIEEIQADNIKLKELLKMFIPELYTHFMRLNVEIEILSMSWWLTLFIDLKIIDLETWFKVIDNLLIGDRDTFFPCLTLSILKCLESTLLRFDSCDLIYRFLSTDNSKFNMKFSDLMKHYIYYSRKKEISEIYRHQ